MSSGPRRDSASSPRAAALRRAALARAGESPRAIKGSKPAKGSNPHRGAPHSAEAMRRAGPGYRHGPPSPSARLGAGSLAASAFSPLLLVPFAMTGSAHGMWARPAALLLAWACAFALCAGAASIRAQFAASAASRRTREAFAWASPRAWSDGDGAAQASLRSIRSLWARRDCDDLSFCRPADAAAPSLAQLAEAAEAGALAGLLASWESRLHGLGARQVAGS